MAKKSYSYENKQRMMDHEQGIVRSEIYCCRTNGVPVPEYKAILFGLEKLISETGVSLKLVDHKNYNLGNIPFGNPDWYQQQALMSRDMGFGRQANATEIWALLRKEPFQEKNQHFDLIVIDQDLTMHPNVPDNNYIFGLGGFPNNIISVKRFLHTISDPLFRQQCLAVMGAHEFGHNLDLVHRKFNTGDVSNTYKKGHCDGEQGPCLMEQVNVPGTRTIQEQTKTILGRGNWLCPDCGDEINVKKELYNGKFMNRK